MLNGLRHDLRHALRSTARTAALTGAILITMALGIGATAAVSSERTQELGIRVALGEKPSQIRWRVIGEGLRLAALGSAVGGTGA